jgi:hypothetical protein
MYTYSYIYIFVIIIVPIMIIICITIYTYSENIKRSWTPSRKNEINKPENDDSIFDMNNNENIFCYIIKALNFNKNIQETNHRPRISDFTDTDRYTDLDIQINHIQQLENMVGRFKEISEKHNVVLGNKFICSWISALSCPDNVDLLGTSLKSKELAGGELLLDWKVSLKAANDILDHLPDDQSKTVEVYDALVGLLCDPKHNGEAVAEAHTMVVETMLAEEHVALPSTWVHLLKGSIRSQGDEELAHLLSNFEAYAPKYMQSGVISYDTKLIEARLRAYARLARGERVLAMLHLFRAAGGTATSRIYEKVVNSIYLCQPCNDAEWFVVTDPGV